MEFKVGAGLACVGLAVATGQWLVPPDTLAYGVRSGLIVVACVLFICGVGLIGHGFFARRMKGTANYPHSGSPLKINFSDEVSHSEFIEEPAQIGSGKVSRKIFWVNIYNDSGKDIKNARGEMSSIKVISSDGTEEDYPLFTGKTFPLTFQGGNQVLDFSPHMNVRLPLLSHATQFMPSFIRIEGHERPFMHESKEWKVKVKVTADGCLPAERAFTATAVDGLLNMKAVD